MITSTCFWRNPQSVATGSGYISRICLRGQQTVRNPSQDSIMDSMVPRCAVHTLVVPDSREKTSTQLLYTVHALAWTFKTSCWWGFWLWGISLLSCCLVIVSFTWSTLQIGMSWHFGSYHLLQQSVLATTISSFNL